MYGQVERIALAISKIKSKLVCEKVKIMRHVEIWNSPFHRSLSMVLLSFICFFMCFVIVVEEDDGGG